MSRLRSNPFASLLAVVSAMLIVFGRVNHDLWWGNWILLAGFAALVLAGAAFLLTRR